MITVRQVNASLWHVLVGSRTIGAIEEIDADRSVYAEPVMYRYRSEVDGSAHVTPSHSSAIVSLLVIAGELKLEDQG